MGSRRINELKRPLQTVEPGADGALVLTPGAAQLRGDLRVEGAAILPNIGYGAKSTTLRPGWSNFGSSGPYRVAMEFEANEGTDFTLEIGQAQLLGKTVSTGDWNS